MFGTSTEISTQKFPGGPVVMTQCFHCFGLGGLRSISGRRTKILQVVWHGKNKTNKQKNSNQKQPTVVLLYGGQELLPGMGTVNASPLHLSLKPSFWLIKRFTRNSFIISGVIIPVVGIARSN